MTGQNIDKITVEGFTSIKSAAVELRELNLLVGANGAGKSNFIRALGMLGRIVDGELGLFVGLAGGASALLSDDPDSGGRMKLEVQLGAGGYSAALIAAAGDELIFLDESVSPSFIRDHRLSIGRGHRESRFTEDDEIKNLDPNAGVWVIINALRGCRVFHFHDTSRNAPVKQQGYESDNLTLHADAGNLAAVLLNLRQTESSSYRRIVGGIRQVAPFFRDFVLVPERSADRLRLRWQQEGSDTVFPADALSDGTLRFICLATLLGQPELPGVIVLDEPELGLHPFAIVQLTEMLRAVSKRSQVVVATQSVTLMNQFEADDLIVVERRNGFSSFERLDQQKLSDWLEEYSLGDLWEKNLLGGRPQAERR
ncbi:MAG TPA: AAA family ATPase [Streptosporangiaceae bacterium]|jgi:predicted ATPase